MSLSFGRQVVDHPRADRDRPAGDFLKPGDGPQRGGLSAPGRPDEHHELALLHLKVQVVQRLDAAAVNLVHVIEGDTCHWETSMSAAGAILIGKFLNRNRRVEHPINTYGTYWSGQCERTRKRQISGRSAYGHCDRAGLDDPRQALAGERGPVGVHTERDPRRLSRFEHRPREPGQPLHRPHHRGGRSRPGRAGRPRSRRPSRCCARCTIPPPRRRSPSRSADSARSEYSNVV